MLPSLSLSLSLPSCYWFVGYGLEGGVITIKAMMPTISCHPCVILCVIYTGVCINCADLT